MQPSQVEVGHPVYKTSAKRLTGGPISIGLTGHILQDCSERVP